MEVDPWGQIKLDFGADDWQIHATVTDVRLVEADHRTAKEALVNRLDGLLKTTPIVLSFGLSRAAQVGHDTEERHWFQVNNIHLQSDPLGTWAA
ncbi:MAG TPA: hypothetical protein VMW62_00355 [Chloroflexota bacterium]|nr:hypothetical protein [Chloroflexota bacterium]